MDDLADNDAPDRCSRLDPATFIRANMRLVHVPALPEIQFYTAHPGASCA
ncbi:MAG: methyltransferase, partial [Mesorhizobium sp.]